MGERGDGLAGLRSAKWAVGFCFFVSGATGLIYQSIWVRLIGLFYGNTTLAVSTVVSAFMGGLALGAWVAGPRADGSRAPIKVYGLLEIGIGIYCAASPWLLSLLRDLYVVTVAPREVPVALLTLTQFALSAVALVMPAALMGATLPILSSGLRRVMASSHETVGTLYAINTFGAVAGAFLAGFVLMPVAGVRLSVGGAAVANVVVGLLAIAYSVFRGEPAALAEEGLEKEAAIAPADAARTPVRFLICAFFLTGLSALTLEVAWTRALSMFLGSSVYGFATILTAFLLGLAIGSWLFAKIWGRRAVTLATFGVVAFGIGLSSLALSAVYPYLPYAFLGLYMGFTFMPLWVLYLLQFSLCAAVTLLPTCLMGMTFPIVAKLCADESGRLGDAVGRSYAANTAGAIIGAACGALITIPALGLQDTIRAACLVYVGVGLAATLLAARGVASGPRAMRAAVFAAGMLAVGGSLAVGLPPWRKAALVSGVFRRTYLEAEDPSRSIAAIERPEDDVLYYRDGSSCTVSVTGSMGNRSLAVNGKADASDLPADMVTQQLSGHLPVLLSSNPAQCLLIGLGSGCSAAAMCAHSDVERVVVAEIEPAVAEGARYFGHINRGILEGGEPKLEMRFIDGRTALLGHEGAYDVIVSEPSNPWMAGVANLFTVEHYEACRRALTPTGLFCQWVQGYSLDRRTLRMMFATVRQVFPQATVWITTPANYLFIARADGAPVDYGRLVAKFAEGGYLCDDLRPFRHDSPGGILASFLLASEDLGRIAEGGDLNTDELPLLEFWAPRGLYAKHAGNYEWVSGFRSADLPEMVGFSPTEQEMAALMVEMGNALLAKGLAAEGARKAEAALEIGRGHGAALVLLAECEEAMGRGVRALEAADRAIRVVAGDARPLLVRARVHLREGSPEEALSAARRAAVLEPGNAEVAAVVAAAERSTEAHER